MVIPGELDAVEMTNFYQQVLSSLQKFNELELRGIVESLVAPSDNEECWIILYMRADRSVDSLLALKHVAHFQAIASIARTIFELKVDFDLLKLLPNAEADMRLYARLELLRVCRASVNALKKRGVEASPTQIAYIDTDGVVIESKARERWHGLGGVNHWSKLTLRARVELLDEKTQLLYDLSYKQMSWNVHAGLQGHINVHKQFRPGVCSQAFNLTVVTYSEILKRAISELEIARHDPKILDKLELALLLPLTETEQDELEVRSDLGFI